MKTNNDEKFDYAEESPRAYRAVRLAVEKRLGRSNVARAFRRVLDVAPPKLRADLLTLDAAYGHEVEIEAAVAFEFGRREGRSFRRLSRAPE